MAVRPLGANKRRARSRAAVLGRMGGVAVILVVSLAGAASAASPLGSRAVGRRSIQPRDTSGVRAPAQLRPGAQPALPTTGPAWTFIGPRPVKDTSFGGPSGYVSGRVTSLATLPASPLDI